MNAIYGAIIGDIVGSRFEFHNIKSKDFKFFSKECQYTDDSAMTIAIAKALLEYDKNGGNLIQIATKYMQKVGRDHIDRGFGGYFKRWILSDNPQPYGSWGNGAAMRISACPTFFGREKDERKLIPNTITLTYITHDSEEGCNGACATSHAIHLGLLRNCKYANHNVDKDKIKEILSYYYKLDFTLDEIRPTYKFNESCQGTVPQAIMCFLESDNFEDAIRNAISLGGDSDTLGAITGSIAGAYYGVPYEFINKARSYLSDDLLIILDETKTYLIQRGE